MASAQCQTAVQRARSLVDQAQQEMAALQTPIVTNGLRKAVDDVVGDLGAFDGRLERLQEMAEQHFSGRRDG